MRTYTVVAVVLSVLAGRNIAQTIDPDSVDINQRESWCTSQLNQCPLLCMQDKNSPGDPASNDCDPETLVYSCVCENGLSPNSSEYSQTIPFYICQEAGNQCVAACGNGNNACASDCRTKNPCGAQDPVRVTTSATPTPSATGSDNSQATDDFADFNGDTEDKKGGADRLLEMGQSYGLIVIVGSIFASFAVLL